MIVLNAVEARVAGVLMEKESTTPEYYPLSLNATVNACNQKSSREPVMQLEEAEVRTALYELEQMGLVRTLADARVSKFEHRMREGTGGAALRRDEVAVLCLLLLRGAQTSAELRARAERLYTFDDQQAVMGTLERMAQREDPLVVLMARQPGSREARWMHLLCGAVEAGVVGGGERSAEANVSEARTAHGGGGAMVSGATGGGAVARPSELLTRVVELEEQMQGLEDLVRLLEDRLMELERTVGGAVEQGVNGNVTS
jgi:uncharacterized protein YceH (UPF0502 family)